MGQFRNNRRESNRDGVRGGGRFGGGSRGFGGRPRSRGARRFGSETREMHEATCDKCGKQCSIPFRPSGDKPVYCNDCFKRDGSSNSSEFSRREERGSSGSGGGISQEQFKQLNKKLDKILAVLSQIEIEVVEDDEFVDEDVEDEDE